MSQVADCKRLNPRRAIVSPLGPRHFGRLASVSSRLMTSEPASTSHIERDEVPGSASDIPAQPRPATQTATSPTRRSYSYLSAAIYCAGCSPSPSLRAYLRLTNVRDRTDSCLLIVALVVSPDTSACGSHLNHLPCAVYYACVCCIEYP